MDQMCFVKGVSLSGEPTENDLHQSLLIFIFIFVF